MKNDAKVPAIGLGIITMICVFAAGIFIVPKISYNDSPNRTLGDPTYSLNLQTVTTTYDADTQYLGVCGDVVTPPTAGTCETIQGILRYQFFGRLVNANQFKVWKSQNPGELSRITAHMQAPLCGSGANPDMKTYYGQFIADVVEAYACAKGTAPIAWPTPFPALDPKRADKTPPTPPTGLTVTP